MWAFAGVMSQFAFEGRALVVHERVADNEIPQDDACEPAQHSSEIRKALEDAGATDGPFLNISTRRSAVPGYGHKVVYFMRHEDPDCVPDGALSLRGVRECAENVQENPVLHDVEVVLTSPASRCLETSCAVFRDVPTFVDGNLYEIGIGGGGLLDRKNGFKVLDTYNRTDIFGSYIQFWPNVTIDGLSHVVLPPQIHKNLPLGDRWANVKRWIINRPETHIAVVSHYYFLQTGIAEYLDKGDFRIADFDGVSFTMRAHE